MDEKDLEATARLIFEQGTLKLQKRTGWWQCGIKDPESVAEHSHRTAIIASLLASAEGGDPARAALLAVWHDSQETRIGDIPHLGRRYLDAASNEKITDDQTAGLPTAAADHIRSLITDYETGGGIEVDCAHDADKLECLFQGVEYRDAGYANVASWIETSAKKLRTKTAQRLAEIAVTMSSQDWLHAVNQTPRDS